MSKQEWLRHWATAGQHDRILCPECNARRQARLANKTRRDRDGEIQRSSEIIVIRTGANWR